MGYEVMHMLKGQVLGEAKGDVVAQLSWLKFRRAPESTAPDEEILVSCLIFCNNRAHGRCYPFASSPLQMYESVAAGEFVVESLRG